ncbi:TBC1 domain member 9 [Parelaphostrongylus tenuis]|uniref:TBC1 domain member 9 n=1 Tax=Parelaphostrongylus tenuis TaxID=148309 RepID=A0AAD5QXJ2_PARTN|nr:TBC1 domain member 9 [Parelaphostrongylus tenuis]
MGSVILQPYLDIPSLLRIILAKSCNRVDGKYTGGECSNKSCCCRRSQIEDSSLIDFVANKSCGSEPSDSGQSPFKMCGENSGDSAPLSDDSLNKVHELSTIFSSPESTPTRLEMLPPMNQIQFIQMWRTLYEMINIGDIDQLLNSLAVVGEYCYYSKSD